MKENPQIENEIKLVFEEMAESFAEKDIKKYLNLYTNNTDVVIYGSQEGEKWTKVNDYRKSVLKDWKLTEKMTIHYDWFKITNSGDVAWTAIDIRFEATIGNQTMNIPGRLTAILVKEQNQWKITQSHFSMAMFL
ncbi:MAG: nuclear transport factor 2 family protein [Candidatus Heimdallarchaeota archaeon]